MTVRAGMQHLVDELERLVDAGTEWDEDALQDMLDRFKVEFREVQLIATPTRTSPTTVVYYDYYLPKALGYWFELPQNDTINPAFYLTTYLFIPVLFGTGDGKATYDDDLKKIVFNADTLGYRHYLTVYSYDLYGAAAEIWSQKASARENYINVKTDNHTLALDTVYQHCLDRYKYFVQKAFKFNNPKFVRRDQGVGLGLYRRSGHEVAGRYPAWNPNGEY